MSRRRSYVDHLEDLEAIQKVQLFTSGMSLEAFAADEQSLYATVRALEIVGEATKRLPERVRSLQPAVPWREMAGIRDVMIHQYDRVDLEHMWRSCPLIQSCLSRSWERIRSCWPELLAENAGFIPIHL